MLGSSDFWREDCAVAGRTRVKVQDECGKALEQSHWFKVQDTCGKALGQSSWLKVQDECGKALERSLWLKVQDLANKPPGALRGGALLTRPLRRPLWPGLPACDCYKPPEALRGGGASGAPAAARSPVQGFPRVIVREQAMWPFVPGSHTNGSGDCWGDCLY